MENQNTHNEVIKFGKHKGERWTRLPFGYLKWMLNEMPKDTEAWAMADSEITRRGDTMPTEVEITNHAIDKASLRVRKQWHEDRGEDEGLYSWLARISTEVLSKQQQQHEQLKHKGCKLIFTYGNYFPTLKTVMNDKSSALKEKKDKLNNK